MADGIAGQFDPRAPAETSNLGRALDLVDPLGRPHQVALYATRTGADTWALDLVVDGAELAGGDPGWPMHIVLGALSFDGEGRLQTATLNTPVVFQWTDAPPSTVAFDFGTALDDGGDGLDGSVRSSNAAYTGWSHADAKGWTNDRHDEWEDLEKKRASYRSLVASEGLELTPDFGEDGVYALGVLAVDYLLETRNVAPEALFTTLTRDAKDAGFEAAFERNIGLTVSDFVDAFNAHLAQGG